MKERFKIHTNIDNSKWIYITDALLLFKPGRQGHRIRFIFWEAPWGKKIHNFRFRIHRYDSSKPWSIKNFRCFIRLPFFYWEKSNGGWQFGTNSWYFWYHEMRDKKRKKKF